MKASEKMRKRQAAAEAVRISFEQTRTYVKWVYDHKEEILSDDCKYVMRIPGCESGGAYIGLLHFKAGPMAECWEHCPSFTLPDGGLVCRWQGSPLSGTVGGLAYNPVTGELHSFHGGEGNDLCFSKLLRPSQPYNRRAKELLESGTVPTEITDICQTSA